MKESSFLKSPKKSRSSRITRRELFSEEKYAKGGNKMTNGKKRGCARPFPQGDCYRRTYFGEYEGNISESKYPTFILRVVRLFGFLTFALFYAAQGIYPCGGKISRGERAKRVRILTIFSMLTSLALATAGYFGFALIWNHPPYKGVSQALLLSTLFLFYLGILGMTELLGFRFAYDKNGFLKRSPANFILSSRRAVVNRSKHAKMRNRQTAYL
jgi:hypothetical protein